MVGGRVCTRGRRNASNLNVLLHSQNGPRTSEPLDELFLSGPSSLGSTSMVSFGDVQVKKRCASSFFHPFDPDDSRDEDYDDLFLQPEKKRRLTSDQLQFLEKSFELENKLEPERKVQLAKELGLQPRQIAIWFQNRRARWKTKQLEKDYDTLQACYDSLKADYQNLLKDKDALNAWVLELKEKLLRAEKSRGGVEQIDAMKLQEPISKHSVDATSEGEGSKVSAMAFKLEDISSAKSDIVDSCSPRNTDGSVHSSFHETANAANVFDPDQSDLSQDEEDNFSTDLFPVPPYVFLKLEDADYSDLSASSCNLGFPVQDHAIWSWSY